MRSLLVLTLSVPLLAGCGSARSDAVAEAAHSFYEALAAGDGAGACELLAPPTRDALEQSAGAPCDHAVLKERIASATGTPRAEVYGTMAQVRWSDETTFLTRYQDRWLVLAAGCALQPHATTGDTNDAGDPEQYECSVEN